MILRWASRRLVLFPDEVADRITSYSVGNERAREAGGILLGSYRGEHLEILDATEPLREDRRSRFSFIRKDRGHQDRALSAWKKSLHTDTFVGEWHTHPENDPSPSHVDLATWQELSTRSREPLLFVIVGWRTNWYGVGESTKLHRASLVTGDAPSLASPP